MKYAAAILVMFLVSCSTSQFTMYRPADETRGWTIECKVKYGDYELIVDDVTALVGEFKFFKNNFETSAIYKGHKLQLFGFKRAIPGPGDSWSEEVHLRVIIDESEVTKFVF